MKKKLIGLFASTGILFSFFAVGQFKGAKVASADAGTYDANGSGTQADPWLIGSKEQWEDLATKVNGITPLNLSGKYFKLSSDITINGTVVGNSTSNTFKGNFDGNDHKITVNYENVDKNYTGVFGILDVGSNVKNLTVVGNLTLKENSSVQCFAGVAGLNKGTIGNCTTQVNIVANGQASCYFGGIAGSNEGTINDCEVAGAFTPSAQTTSGGGIAGLNSGIIRNCSNVAEYLVEFKAGDSSNIGGIAGQNDVNGRIYHCSNEQHITTSNTNSEAHNLGGIVGINLGEVHNSFNKGRIDTYGTFGGGIVGENDGKILNSYNDGIINIHNEKNGGVVGVNSSKLINVINRSAITNKESSGKTGGFCGINQEVGSFVNCFEVSTTTLNVVGEQKGESAPLKMNRLQGTTDNNCLYTGEDAVCEGKALIDLLNGFIDDENNAETVSGFEHWTRSFDMLPYTEENLHKVFIAPTVNGKIIVASNYVSKGTLFGIRLESSDIYTLDALSYDDNGSMLDIFSKRQITMPDYDVTIYGTFKQVHTHNLVKVEAKDATCFEDGHPEYYTCTCGHYYFDELAEKEIEKFDKWSKDEGRIQHLDHFLKKVKAQEATAFRDGYNACFVCDKCNTYFADQFGEFEIGNAEAYEAWKLNDGLVPARGLSAGGIVLFGVGGLVGACLIAYIVMFFVWKGTGKGLGFLVGSFEGINGLFSKKKKKEENKAE